VTFEFRPAVRENVPLLIGLAGGTGSGKTFSALRLARGIAKGEPFAIVDTENGRAKHYADLFPEMRHGEIKAPFRPDKYAEAITAGALQFPVVVVDSASHEWAGDGGCLDWHDELMGGDQKKNLSAWIEPKRHHKRLVTRLLQLPDTHVILCFRAEPKVEAIRENGQTRIVPKASLTGLDGWLPISEKMLPYELTASFLLMADNPGVPKPIKLQEQLKSFFPLDQTISEDAGARLAAWAAGSNTGPQGPTADDAKAREHATGTGASPTREEALEQRRLELTAQLSELAAKVGKRTVTDSLIAKDWLKNEKTPAKHLVWLEKQITAAEAAVALQEQIEL
jgi:hypothetical protein